MEKFRIYNKKKLFEETHLLNKGKFPRWELRHTYCMQTRRDCVRMGLWEILPSQLCNVQKDHHGPTYWSFSWGLLRVIFKTASLLKKKSQNSTQPIHPGSDNTSTPELRAGCEALQGAWQNSLPLFCLCSGVDNVSLLGAGHESVSKNKNTDPDLRLCWVPQHWGQRPSGNYLLWYSWSSSSLCEDILHRSFQCHCIHYVLWFMINWKPMLAVFNTSQELQI